MPKLKSDIFAVPDGDLHPRWFRAGEDVSGDVERAAMDQGKLADEVAPAATAPRRGRPPKNKAMCAPENK